MSTEDWQYLYDERAAICEFVYQRSRPDAEAIAWRALIDAGCQPYFSRQIRKTMNNETT
jgi:hypothetical protein